jgi:hypothetical protein
MRFFATAWTSTVAQQPKLCITSRADLWQFLILTKQLAGLSGNAGQVTTQEEKT